jgi:hypothetical protein
MMKPAVRSHPLHWIALVIVIILGGSLSRSAYATPLGNAVVASPCGEAEFNRAPPASGRRLSP